MDAHPGERLGGHLSGRAAVTTIVVRRMFPQWGWFMAGLALGAGLVMLAACLLQ